MSINDLADTDRSNTDIVCQPILAQSERLHEIFQEHFARVYGG